jgi:hypothetical protein
MLLLFFCFLFIQVYTFNNFSTNEKKEKRKKKKEKEKRKKKKKEKEKRKKMFNTLSNFSRSADKYGDVHFISFLGATLSRLAYLNDNRFLTSYDAIMGSVIHSRILQGLNNATSLSDLLDDQAIFGLTDEDIFKDYMYEHKGKKYIDFIKLSMPQNINIINGEVKGKLNYPLRGEPTPPDSVKYISIAWSNYGEVYVVADKRMPNILFLLFRGTYSAKTAGLYTKPTSVVPLSICNNDNSKQFLYGIFKVTSEMIHTLIEAMHHLASDFLGATDSNPVKIFTTGHSLGGAMCSNFAYLWMNVKQTAPYNAEPYNILASNIICISLGAPRCMGELSAKQFCEFVKQKKILFLRITTRGDPIPAMPPKLGYQHPCSDDSAMRIEVSEDCNSQLTMRPVPNVNYDGVLDCQNYKTRAFIPNPLSHTIYLNILYVSAVDIAKFFAGMGTSQEVLRTPEKSTVCRLIMGQNTSVVNHANGVKGEYKAIFFDVNKARETPTEETNTNQEGGAWPKIGGPVAEDKRMNSAAFLSLIGQMVPLTETGKLCPKQGQMAEDPVFDNNMMPDLSCSVEVQSGGRKRKYTQKRKRRNKSGSKRLKKK